MLTRRSIRAWRALVKAMTGVQLHLLLGQEPATELEGAHLNQVEIEDGAGVPAQSRLGQS